MIFWIFNFGAQPTKVDVNKIILVAMFTDNFGVMNSEGNNHRVEFQKIERFAALNIIYQ
jgi:hypothetical protein